ncbi:hypothetical protein [Luteolibacter sp.]
MIRRDGKYFAYFASGEEDSWAPRENSVLLCDETRSASSMEITPENLKPLVLKMTGKLTLAEKAGDIVGVILIAKVLASVAIQMTMNKAPWPEQKVSTEELLNRQADLIRYEQQKGNYLSDPSSGV